MKSSQKSVETNNGLIDCNNRKSVKGWISNTLIDTTNLILKYQEEGFILTKNILSTSFPLNSLYSSIERRH